MLLRSFLTEQTLLCSLFPTPSTLEPRLPAHEADLTTSSLEGIAMKCPKCQTENAETARFCKVCGLSLKADVACPQCRHANLPDSRFCEQCGRPLPAIAPHAVSAEGPRAAAMPTSVANGRYHVRKSLGEGGKKKVYLAHDTVLDRDVAFALIKTEKAG
jgi:eukaryotic-like serine/threonine-protein kinase